MTKFTGREDSYFVVDALPPMCICGHDKDLHDADDMCVVEECECPWFEDIEDDQVERD